MAKRGSPALYELIRARGPEPAPPTSTAATGRGSGGEPPDEAAPMPGGWLRPGRLLRVPLGYVFVAIAAAIVLASLTYMAGYSRGQEESRHLLHDDAEHVLGGSGASSVPRDPLESRATAAPPASAGTLATHDPAAIDRQPAGWDPIESNPRQRGYHYLMLVTTNRAGAERVAKFGREHGLETYVIPTNNPRLFQVFCLPGFESDTSPAAEAHREEALRIGEMYRAQFREPNPFEMSRFNQYVPRQ